MIGLIDSRVRQAARRIGRTLFRRQSDELPVGHGHRWQIVAQHLSKVPGSSLIGCTRDGELLSAIVHSNGHGTEVVGLFCPECHWFVATPDGVLGEQRESH
jgi:hypothetical protein